MSSVRDLAEGLTQIEGTNATEWLWTRHLTSLDLSYLLTRNEEVGPHSVYQMIFDGARVKAYLCPLIMPL